MRKQYQRRQMTRTQVVACKSLPHVLHWDHDRQSTSRTRALPSRAHALEKSQYDRLKTKTDQNRQKMTRKSELPAQLSPDHAARPTSCTGSWKYNERNRQSQELKSRNGRLANLPAPVRTTLARHFPPFLAFSGSFRPFLGTKRLDKRTLA